jgi:pimeloyl-ACP methyl ester carboxylesterase
MEQRAALELVELIASPVYYGIGLPRGDGAPVLLLSGFMGSDDLLIILHGWLRRMGYRPYRLGIPFLAGPYRDLLARVCRRVEAVAEEAGRPLTLIGQSMGGSLSCAAARQCPELVEHVITLGSPLCADPRRFAHPLMVLLGELLNTGGSPAEEAMLQGADLPENVALTCIYTREDAVLHWPACIPDNPRAAVHEVRGTHSGLAWNAAAYRLLARALVKPLAVSRQGPAVGERAHRSGAANG